MAKKLRPMHPGEHLADILKEAGLSANALALRLRVPANRISSIVQGKRAITAETALRLARYFGTSAQFLDEPAIEIRSGCSQRRSGGPDQ